MTTNPQTAETIPCPDCGEVPTYLGMTSEGKLAYRLDCDCSLHNGSAIMSTSHGSGYRGEDFHAD